MTAVSSRILGGLDANLFLGEYWQKKPLLIRAALGDLPQLSADELAGLALDEDVESRLVCHDPNTQLWQIEHGPFNPQRLQNLPASHWTLLVQAVDQWLPELHALLDEFDFLPRWRVDDIMVSCAADQGSVGPHFDNYDVFLLQTSGQRRWLLGQHCDVNTPLVTDAPLPLLADFEHQQDYLLAPGDMLYLPPGLAHWGIAEGDCVTCSIGFRAPTAIEMLNDLTTELMSGAGQARAYIDPPLTAALANKNIDPAFIKAAQQMLLEQLNDEALLTAWFARFMTTRKYPDLELVVDPDAASWRQRLAHGAYLAWHPCSRYAAIRLTGSVSIAVDGELYPTTPRLAELFNKQNRWYLADVDALNAAEQGLVARLVRQGSLQLATDS